MKLKQSVIYDLVENISPLDELEKKHQRDVLEWIDSSEEICRIKKPATPPKHLVSYTAVFDAKNQKLLLGDHKKALLWLPPGGHVEPDEHPTKTAHRELKEELGVDLSLLNLDPLFVTVTKTAGTTVGHTDVSLWYVFGADCRDTYMYDEREFNDIRWFSLSDLPLEKSDPHMSRFRDKLKLRF